LLEGYAGARNLFAINDSGIAERLHNSALGVPGLLSELRGFVSDNPPQVARVDKIGRESHRFLALLDLQRADLNAGQRPAALEKLELGAAMLGEIRTSIDAILSEEARLDRLRMDRLRRSASRQFWFLMAGGVATVTATTLLGAALIQGVITRLNVLRENALRLAKGAALQSPLKGDDEIAEVDRAFHEMACSLNQQKQENEMFIYSVSHDLRSPLINLQGFSQELGLAYRDIVALFDREGVPAEVRSRAKRMLQENVEDSIRFIQTAVGRVARIIDALLRLSRAGRVEYQWQMIEVGPLVQRIVDALQDTISAKKAEVLVHNLPSAWGDPTAVEQVFANLIGNAVSYLDPARPGRIEVGTTDTPPSPELADLRTYFVKDNGLGIPAAYHGRVFRAFSRFQVDAPQGEGVGLALVHRMVERLGGKVWMESGAGAGTMFFVALAAARPPSAISENEDRSLPLASAQEVAEHGS
jgi:signal transduction histidine kinase